MPTNEQRRATAKRKLERQLERRAAAGRERRHLTIIGAAVAAVARDRGGRVTVVVTNKDTDSTARRHHQPRRPARAADQSAGCRPLPPFKAPANLGANCQYPASPRTGRQAGQPAAHRQGADRSGAGQRQHGHQSGPHRPAAGQQRITLHGQQFRQPGAAEVLQRHQMPPADHRAGLVGAAVRRPERRRHRRPGLPVRQRIPDRPVPARRPGAARSRCSTRAARWRWPTPGTEHQRQPVLPGLPGFAAAAELHRVRHDPADGLATLDKIAKAGVVGGGPEGKPVAETVITSVLPD